MGFAIVLLSEQRIIAKLFRIIQPTPTAIAPMTLTPPHSPKIPEKPGKAETVYPEILETAIWGAVGGVSQELLAAFIRGKKITTTQATTSPTAQTPRTEYGVTLGFIGISLLLGAVSAIIGTALAMEETRNRKKAIALSIVFGLSFPSVIQTSIRSQTVEAEKQQVQTNSQQASKSLQDAGSSVEKVNQTLTNIETNQTSPDGQQMITISQDILDELKQDIQTLDAKINQSQADLSDVITPSDASDGLPSAANPTPSSASPSPGN
jgi:hypothetical protein